MLRIFYQIIELFAKSIKRLTVTLLTLAIFTCICYVKSKQKHFKISLILASKIYERFLHLQNIDKI